MNFLKLLILTMISMSLMACGSDSSNNNPVNGDTTPITDGLGDDVNGNDGTDDTIPDDNGQGQFSQVFEVKARNTTSFNFDKNWNCSQPVESGKISHQKRAQIFQRLCQKASKVSFNRLSNKCGKLNGVIFQAPNYDSNTSRTKEGHCRIFHCEVKAAGPCGVN